jgi:hypothetical protein
MENNQSVRPCDLSNKPDIQPSGFQQLDRQSLTAQVAQARYRTDILRALHRSSRRTDAGCMEWTGYQNQFGYGRICVTLADGSVKLKTVHSLWALYT